MKRPTPAFSVIVPFLNEERWLPLCLTALQTQTMDRHMFELIFVDNGSTDRSIEILHRYSGVTVLSEPHRDPYLARNRGILAARAEHLVFLDADCIAEPDWLSQLWAAVQTSRASILLGYLAHPATASVLLRSYEHYYDQKLKYLLKWKLSDYYFGHAGNMVVRAEVFRDLGLFSAMPVVGDSELIHRLTQRRPSAVIGYAEHARVVHAEVGTVAECLRKLVECGEHSETLARIGPYRPIPLAHKWRILAQCIRERRYDARMALATAAMLALGWLSYSAGRMKRARSRLQPETGHTSYLGS